MNGPRKNNAKDTAMFTSKRANRRDLLTSNPGEQGGGGEGSNLLSQNENGGDGSSYVQSKFQDQKTAASVQTVSGGLGIHKSRKGQIVVKNQFDAVHFLRLKAASDAVKSQLADLVQRSMLLDSVLDGITVQNAAQYGNLGYQYLNNITRQISKEEGVKESKGVPLGGGIGGSIPHPKPPSGFGNVDSLKMKSNGNQVLEMVQRVGAGGAAGTKDKAALHAALDDEMRITKENSKAKDAGGGRREGYRDDVTDGNSDMTEKESSSQLDAVSHPPSLTPPIDTRRKNSRENDNDDDDDDDDDDDNEFDHDFGETKPPKKKGPPSEPPPRKKRGSAPSSRDASRQSSRQGSRRGSRDSSAASSPQELGRRAPMNSVVSEDGFKIPDMKEELEQQFRRLERKGELDAVEGGGTKKVKKVKKKRTEEEKRQRKERKESTRRGSKEKEQQERERLERDKERENESKAQDDDTL